MAVKPREPGPLHIRLLGTPGWSTEARCGPLTRKHAALVACVAVQRRVARDTVAALLWDSRHPERRRDSLYQHVAALREDTGHAVFVQDEIVAFAPGVVCDVDGDALADWPPRELLARSRFLDGGDFAAMPRFERWLQTQRIDWRERICAALVRAGTRITASDELAQAVRLARELTAEAPMREGGWRALMWFQFLAGDHAAAFEAHAQVLQRCAGSGRAGNETEALWQAIRRGIDRPPPRGDAGPLHPPRLVGRAAQWAALAGAWALHRPVLLVGEGGIGKSRLLADLLRRHGRAVVVAGGDGDAPYATLATLLRALLAQPPASDRGLAALDAAGRRTLAAILPELGRSRPGAQADPVALRLAVARVLEQAMGDGLLALALDDVHRADAASLAALRALAGGALGQRLFFAFAARPLPAGALQELVDDWRAESQPLTLVELPPLTCPEVAELMATLDLDGAPARVGAEALHAHVGGNPLFVLETLRELAQQQPTAAAPLPRPGVAMPVLARRIAAVAARERPLLQLAAVLDADLGLAAAALGLPAAESAAMSAALQAQGIVSNGRYVHDLMREAALASLDAAERLRWHAVAAGTLDADPRVPRARIAWHWELAERWSQAGAAYRLAADAAGGTGSHAEARLLLAQAAACLRKAGDQEATFDVLYGSLPTENYLGDAAGVERLAGQLAALATTPEQRARVAIVAARAEVLRYRRGGAALAAATAAVALAGPFPHLHCDAAAQNAVALAQAERHDEAIAASRRALALAESSARWRQARDIAAEQVYIHYEAGHLAEATATTQALVDAYEAAGDIGGAGALQGQFATLLLLAGDPEAAIAPAEAALLRHRQVDRAALSPLAIMLRTMLGSAYAAVGRFDAALAILVEAGRPITERMNAVRPRTLLLQAHLWLTLGEADLALEALGGDVDGWLSEWQVQRCWALARAARMQGKPDGAHLERMARSAGHDPAAPLVHGAWLEWSRQGDARSVAAQMEVVAARYAEACMPGTARSAALRRLDRLNEIDDQAAIAAAAALARTLRPALHAGLHPLTYVPEALAIVARALARAGDAAAAADARDDARRWILEVALPHVPARWRDGFLQRNPVNRALLAAAP